jgi:Right handed beta helix region
MTMRPGPIWNCIASEERLMFCSKWYLMLTVLVFAIVPGLSQGRTWFVEKDGSGDYTIIQDAIDAAAAGDTIRIGPGRFEEYRTYTYPGGIYDVGIHNSLPSIAILGTGETATTIGVTVDGDGDYSAGLFNDVDIAGINVSITNLTFEGGFFGALPLDGPVDFSNCTFKGSRNGIWSYASGTISKSRFEEIENTAVASFAPGHDLAVDDCEFVSCSAFGFYFQSTTNMNVRNCTFTDCQVGGLFDISSGSITDCSVSEMMTYGTGFAFLGNGQVQISGCTIDGAYRSLGIDGGSNLIFEGNIFAPTEGESIRICNGTPIFHNNHILPGSGYSVYLGCSLPSEGHLDLTNNYWGTSEPDSVAAWIFDANDVGGPRFGIVDFEPFSATPLPTESPSFDGFKAMFR